MKVLLFVLALVIFAPSVQAERVTNFVCKALIEDFDGPKNQQDFSAEPFGASKFFEFSSRTVGSFQVIKDMKIIDTAIVEITAITQFEASSARDVLVRQYQKAGKYAEKIKMFDDEECGVSSFTILK